METQFSILKLLYEKKVNLLKNLIWATLLCALFCPLFGLAIFLTIFPVFQKESKNSGLPKNQRKKVLIAGSNSMKGMLTQCLKITEKVSFKIASYVYILSGQKLIKNAKNEPFGEFLKTLLPDRSF